MSKYIDSNETRRLSRLKNVKSSIGSKISHNGWLKKQIEKRRIENLRQRKEEAKRKPIGDGIQVDTKVSKSDAVSKCGLKLKVTMKQGQIIRDSSRRKTTYRKSTVDKPSTLDEAPQRKQLDWTSATRPKKYVPRRANNDKENNHHATTEESNCNITADHEGRMKKGSSNTSKKYFMDIDSLRREHANAIKMLEELDINEGNKRRSLISGNDHSTSLTPGENEENDSSDDEMQQQQNRNFEMSSGMHSNEVDVAIDDEFTKFEECSSTNSRSRRSFESVNEEEYSYSGADCINDCCSARSIEIDETNCVASVAREVEADIALTDDSFLNNMTHLSISLRDEFDNEGAEEAEWESNGEEDEEEREAFVPSPI